jgi:hypothetical protein
MADGNWYFELVAHYITKIFAQIDSLFWNPSNLPAPLPPLQRPHATCSILDILEPF